VRLAEELGVADALVAAAKSGEPCLGLSDLPPQRHLVLVDLGVPRNIDPAVRGTPNIDLLDLGDLWDRRTPSPADDPAELAIFDLAERFWARFEVLALESWVDALRRSTEELRLSELETARPFLGTLTPEQEVAVERLTQRLVARILLPPTERLRALPPGPEGERLRRFALELLGPTTTDP
jgi:glutamyl-tRNA reductase